MIDWYSENHYLDYLQVEILKKKNTITFSFAQANAKLYISRNFSG